VIAIVDYKCGNLFSLSRSFSYIGAEVKVTGSEEELRKSDKIVLPGVGAFGSAMDKLRERGLDRVVIDEAKKGKPLLGICLGMQLLCDLSYEFGVHQGLGLIHGEVADISGLIPTGLKIPHMGWNRLDFPQGKKKHPLFKHISDSAYVYFVHSFAAVKCGEAVIAAADYGAPLTAAIADKNVYGVQFHPEKSGSVGLDILRAFCEVV
jgi:glutamine amidotransferase